MSTYADNRSVIAEGKYLRLMRGALGWEFVERKNSRPPVGIVALTGEDCVLLVEQFRVPIGKNVIEIPAGLVGDIDGEESIETAAKRELLEETGYEAERITVLSDGPTSAGMSTETITLVRAQGLKKIGAGVGDGSENITLHEVRRSEIDGWLKAKVKAGVMIDAKIYAALYFLDREGSEVVT